MEDRKLIERTFFSVGQALFCRERVDNRTIIYDCGGQTIQKVSKVIDREYPNNGNKARIDALFISHYDRDHINGVFYLLQRCVVRHLFLPMVSSIARMYSLYRQHYTPELLAFYSNPKSYLLQLSRETKVHYVDQVEFGRQQAIDTTNDIDELGGNDLIGRTYRLRFKDIPDWIYVPFNRRVMTQEEEAIFLDALELPHDAKVGQILYKWKQTKIPFKEIIKEMGIISIDKINDYSMTLYSGSIHARNACLYLGDYNAKSYFQELHDAYALLWENIRVIQVPHHGSEYNYSCGLCQGKTEYVASCKKGPYGIRAVDPLAVITHIQNVAGQPCYATYIGDVIVH